MRELREAISRIYTNHIEAKTNEVVIWWSVTINKGCSSAESEEQSEEDWEEAEVPSLLCSCLAWTLPHIAHKAPLQQPSDPYPVIKRQNQNHTSILRLYCNLLYWKSGSMKKVTLAAALRGYSPFSLASTHWFTLFSLSLGVAWRHKN